MNRFFLYFSALFCFVAVLLSGCAVSPGLPVREGVSPEVTPERILLDPAASPYRRAEAARLIGRQNDDGGLAALVSATEDPAPQVRVRVAEAFGRIGDPSVVPSLELLVRDEDARVRRAAAIVLFRKGLLRSLHEEDPLLAREQLERLMREGNTESMRILTTNTCSEVGFEETNVRVEAARFMLTLPGTDLVTKLEAEAVLSQHQFGEKRFSAG